MKLFLPQTTLEEWALEDKADLKDGKLVVAEGGASYPVSPAVHFKNLVTGTDDNALVQKVKTTQQLEALGAEHMADSVLLGETAYEVTEGYIAEVQAPAARPEDPKKKPSSPETDLLAAFLLNKLS